VAKFEKICQELFVSPCVVVDVGASGGVGELRGFPGLCEVHAAEPRLDSFNALNGDVQSSPYASFKSYDKGLAKTPGIHTLYVTRTPEASSLYPPNLAIVQRWRKDGILDVVAEVPIDCITLEQMLIQGGIDYVDLIKVDTQGSELDILLSGGERLNNISVIKCELEFVELYKGQPLFDDVVRELSARGFRYVGLFDGHVYSGKSIWGDAIFIKKRFDSRDKMIKAAAILINEGYYEDARWLVLDHAEPIESFKLMADAHILESHPNSRYYKRSNEILKALGEKIPFLEKIRVFLSRYIRRTKLGRVSAHMR